MKHAHTIYRDFSAVRGTFHLKSFDILDIFAKNIDFGYKLESPRV